MNTSISEKRPNLNIDGKTASHWLRVASMANSEDGSVIGLNGLYEKLKPLARRALSITGPIFNRFGNSRP